MDGLGSVDIRINHPLPDLPGCHGGGRRRSRLSSPCCAVSIAPRTKEKLVRMVSQSLVVIVSMVIDWRSRFCWSRMLWSQVVSRS